MPPLKRRPKSSGSLNVGIGTLLADENNARVLAQNAKAEAEREEAKKTNEASGRANALIKDFDGGVITYEEFHTGIEAIKASATNSELKANLDSALRVGGAKNQMNLMDSKTREFNAGTLKYADYKKFLEGQNVSNNVIKETVAKNLAGARSAENNRVMTVAYQDYINGKTDIKQYQNILGDLRNATGQTPADMETIGKAIDSARVVEGQMNDSKTYARWQTGEIGAGEAMAYFNARIATAKTPQELASATTALTNIKSSADAAAKSSGAAYTKLIDENANKDMESYYKNVVEPGTKACDGDPVCVQKLYDGYGARALQWSQQGGNNSISWKGESDRAGLAGTIAASTAMYKKLTDDFTASMTKANADKNASPESTAAAIRDAATRLLAGETSGFTTDAQKADLMAKRTEAARQIQEIATQMIEARTLAQQSTQGSVQRLYDDLLKAQRDQTTNSATMAKAGIPIVKNADGTSTIDLQKFAQWIQSDIGRNAQLAYDLGNAKKLGPDSDATARKELEALLATAKVAGANSTSVVSSLYQTQFPGLNKDQAKAAAGKTNETGQILTNSNQLQQFLNDIGSNPGFGGGSTGGDNYARDPKTLLGGAGLVTSVDENGNTVLSLYGDPNGNAIDLGNPNAKAGALPEAPGVAERGKTTFGLPEAPFTKPVQAGVDVNQRMGERGQTPPSTLGPNAYDYSGPTPVVRDEFQNTTPVDAAQRSGERSSVSAITPLAGADVSAGAAPQFDATWMNSTTWGSGSPSTTGGMSTPQFQSWMPASTEPVVTEPTDTSGNTISA